jgi:hypothetical protein
MISKSNRTTLTTGIIIPLTVADLHLPFRFEHTRFSFSPIRIGSVISRSSLHVFIQGWARTYFSASPMFLFLLEIAVASSSKDLVNKRTVGIKPKYEISVKTTVHFGKDV